MVRFLGDLHFTSQHDCFLNLPGEWTKNLDGVMLEQKLRVFRVSRSTPDLSHLSLTLCWSGNNCSASSGVKTFEIDSQFALGLGLRNGEEMCLELIEQPLTICNRVTLVPSSPSAWPDIAQNSDFIEDQLLRIVRVISLGLEFPLWIPPERSRFVSVRVAEMQPNHRDVVLSEETVVEILPTMAAKQEGFSKSAPFTFSSSPITSLQNPFPWTSFIWDMFSKKKSGECDSLLVNPYMETPISNGGLVPQLEQPVLDSGHEELEACLRVQELWPDLHFEFEKDEESLAVAFVNSFSSQCTLPNEVLVDALLRLIPVTREASTQYEIFLRLVNLDSCDLISPAHIGVSPVLMQELNLQKFDIVQITVLKSSFDKAIYPRCRMQEMFTTNSTRRPIGVGFSSFPFVCEEMMEMISCALSLTSLLRDEIHRTFSSTYSGILLCGHFGTGKSAVISEMTVRLAAAPCLVYTDIVECKYLRGKRPDTLRKLLEAKLQEAVQKQPSVIFLDDVEFLAPNVVTDNEAELDYTARVAQILVDLQDRLQRTRERVLVIGTTASKNGIQNLLVNCGTSSVFQYCLDIPALDHSHRLELLKVLFSQDEGLSSDNIRFDEVAARTDGYVLRDFAILLKRVKHQAVLRRLMRNLDGDLLTASTDDFVSALSSVQPLSARALSTSGQHLQLTGKWNDVGGLDGAVRILKEVFEMPMKYPQLYAKCPMRLPKGVLLYGAPGTGKTFLAGVTAKEVGINLINVRGPELLSKYIGASEAKVRDVFERARAARPCLIFFDEFDAIAPRRGRDSTGVTDRVVNQLLTELDGVESLEGVFVLAATSHIELIDPAVLRPGRIDKYIYCPMPNLIGRLEILKALTQKLPVEADLDLNALADATDNFTGADLKSVLADAQLEAVECSMANKMTMDANETVDKPIEISYRRSVADPVSDLTKTEKQKIITEIRTVARNSDYLSEKPKQLPKHIILISNEHVIKALRGKMPSVSDSERSRYATVAQDLEERGPSSLHDTYSKNTPMKVTFA